jgi:hypothetical protein
VHTRVDPTPAPEPSRAAPKPAPSTDLLALRRTHQAVRSLLRQPSPLAAVTPDVGMSTWTKADIKPIQRELRRMRLYDKGIDGIIGFYSEQGLVEAFGGDEWRTMPAADVLSKLKAATRLAAGGGKSFRYGELFKDGVLETAAFMAFLDGVIAQKSSEGVVKDMNKQMRAHEQNYSYDPFTATGMDDNPRR